MVLELDPEAAARRKDAGRRNAYVQPFREPSGNAGMIARELPSDEVLASWQHVEQRALDLRAAGIPGTLEELRVRAYLDLLQERRTCLAGAVPGSAGTSAAAGPQDIGPEGNGGGASGSGAAGARGEAVKAAIPPPARAAAATATSPARMPGPAWPRWPPSLCRGPR